MSPRLVSFLAVRLCVLYVLPEVRGSILAHAGRFSFPQYARIPLRQVFVEWPCHSGDISCFLSYCEACS